jgi:hypothetical protein
LSPGERLGRFDCGRRTRQHRTFLGNRFGNTGRRISDFFLFALILGIIAGVNRENTKRIASKRSNNCGSCRSNRNRCRSSRQLCTGTPNNLPRFHVTRIGAPSFTFAFLALSFKARFFGAVA